MNIYCSNCLKEENLSDFVEGTRFKDVEDKTYCVKCFDEMEDNLIFCEECCEYGHRNENFSETYIEREYNNEAIYYHIKCLPDYLLCPICKEYLEKEDCIECFIDNDLQIEHHKRCIEEAKNDINNFDLCKVCCISFLRKCLNCENRFKDCFNENCEAYNYENFNDTDPYNLIPNFCSRRCYNSYGI